MIGGEGDGQAALEARIEYLPKPGNTQGFATAH